MFKTKTLISSKYLKDAKLMGWGFFWENQEPGGIGLNFSNINHPEVKAATLQMQHAFENKEWFLKENPLTPALIMDLKNNLLVGGSLLPQFLAIKNPSPTRVEQHFMLLYRCFLSYLILLDQGICREDEYNGFVFYYSK
jgi:hypothetical protein